MKNTNLRLTLLLGLLPCITYATRDTLHFATGTAVVTNTSAKIVITPTGTPDNAARAYQPVTILYRVQILALKNPITLETVKVNGVEGDVYSFESNGLTRYYMGEFRDLKSALDFKEQLVKNGFEDACIVAYKNGDRITIKESLSVLGEDK